MRKIRPTRLPRNPDGRILVHLGCGRVNAPGFINIDLMPLRNVHYVHTVCPLEMFQDGQVDLIYGSHILEHFSRNAASAALAEWYRVLKPGGILRLAVPDFKVLVRIYGVAGLPDMESMLMGGQDYEGNFHQSVFDEPLLRDLLTTAGFRDVRRWTPSSVADHPFEDTSGLMVVAGGEQHLISLNLEAVK